METTATETRDTFIDEEFAKNVDQLRSIASSYPHITLHMAVECLGLRAHTNAPQNTFAEITWLLTHHAAPEQVKEILGRLTTNEKGEPRDIALDEQALLEAAGHPDR